MNAILEPNLIDLKDNNLNKRQRVTKIVQLVWRKWHRNYLSELQQSNKWVFEKDNVNIGDLVLLVDDNLPTYKWSLGRIIDIYYGVDNKIRVLSIKIQSGIVKRTVSKCVCLPMPE
ncbi:integrase catalytic domain-containing protein [Caerostris darwini]|uniref:Integrase catalytic domain-containing protein n=1 Tax=Caerostris darwini TaxID=1538125 RepID=A0AAV4PLB1_9ARAC|nr:integrase catalytic domain-containing protein [Caerostris darwini]